MNKAAFVLGNLGGKALAFQAVIEALAGLITDKDRTIIPATSKQELRDALRGEDVILYYGHGTFPNGDWVLEDGDTVSKQEIIEWFTGGPTNLDVYSFCCFSHTWTKQRDFYRFIGFSNNENPISDGQHGVGYLLKSSTYERKIQFLEKIYSGNEAAVSYLRGKINQLKKFSMIAAESFVFNETETVLRKMIEKIDVSLIQPVPSIEQRGHILQAKADFPRIPTHNGTYYPRGFPNFPSFTAAILDLHRQVSVLYTDVTLVVHGSSVTGYRHAYKEGQGPFFDSQSDYDVAVCSATIFGDVDEAVKRGDFNTEPIAAENHGRFGPFGNAWNSTLSNLRWNNRTVNFMVYMSQEHAQHHSGLSLPVYFFAAADGTSPPTVETGLTGNSPFKSCEIDCFASL